MSGGYGIWDAYIPEDKELRSKIQEAQGRILSAFPETELEDGVRGRRVPDLMELVEMNMLDEYTIRLISPPPVAEMIAASSLESVRERVQNILRRMKGYKKQKSPVPSGNILIPFCTLYPPPSGGKAELTCTIEKTSGFNAEFKLFNIGIGGGMSFTLSKTKTFVADDDIPKLISTKVVRTIDHYYRESDKAHQYIARFSPPSDYPFFQLTNLTPSTVTVFGDTNMERIDGFGSLVATGSSPDSSDYKCEKKTHWKWGFTDLSLGKEFASTFNLSFEGENTQSFNIHFEFPKGHKYYLWRKKDETPLVPFCTESFDPNEY